ncbi:hypothetical protein [Lentzea aerocolonigenes]|uniref:hypothetical protein n=1 Tax=Lentzea aerocolonigenes TaxID=68170 RepID=UPI0004C3EEB8|nr:hypothetical protein [Lentzea aerocolonigenes]MCP2249725.1 hypothetical protein [Lentzea aerocolonigenes]
MDSRRTLTAPRTARPARAGGGRPTRSARFARGEGRRAGYDGSKPVRLIGCDAAGNDFAKQLSKHLDAAVLAPTKPAWTDANGRVFTSDPEIRPDGEWETHQLLAEELRKAKKDGRLNYVEMRAQTNEKGAQHELTGWNYRPHEGTITSRVCH